MESSDTLQASSNTSMLPLSMSPDASSPVATRKRYTLRGRCLVLLVCLAVIVCLILLVRTTLIPCWTTANEMAFINKVVAGGGPGPVPLQHAHSHNDYERPLPLTGALALGFCSVEADVHLSGGKLYIGHVVAGSDTIEDIYLTPLAARIAASSIGTVYNRSTRLGLCETVTLLVDLKTTTTEAWDVLEALLRRPDFQALTGCGGQAATLATAAATGVKWPPLMVIVSGISQGAAPAFAAHMVSKGTSRCSWLDGRDPATADANVQSVARMYSRAWGGDLENSATLLRSYVAAAHALGARVRFWNSPDTAAQWKRLLAAGVDIISTDQLSALYAFLNG